MGLAPYDGEIVRKPEISQRIFILVAVAAAGCYALLVLTGGAVRLTGSGLGCPDWPSCYQHQFTSALSYHPLIEFGNRCITAAVSVISILAYFFALCLRERRRDLTWLSFGLVLGLIAQIVLGGIVVLTKLNPYLVSLHFVLTFVVLADALILAFRAIYGPRGSSFVLDPALIWLYRLLLGVLTLLVSIGSVVSGSGPHAGAPGTRRIPIAFHDIAELHADVALFLIGLTLASLFAIHYAKPPFAIERRARRLFELMALQGVLGYTQYFLHDSAIVVEFHLAGVTTLWCAMIWFYLHLRAPQRTDEHSVDAPMAEVHRVGQG
jgi:cytochrome c oxidase assembly protein subunit 15